MLTSVFSPTAMISGSSSTMRPSRRAAVVATMKPRSPSSVGNPAVSLNSPLL